ncbi:MAG TPA: NUDIX domain-containing protein [Candidatus Paceibacterota bacterium]|nr:NUDIX domain-containing protein [Candidatus Paceibacterota bacterium]
MDDKDLHFVGKVAQKAIIEHDGMVLVCKGVGDTVWEFPGGRLHKDESPQNGLAREIFEELHLSVEVERPIYTCLSWHAKSRMHNMFVAYLCSAADISGLKQNEEVVEKRWVTKVELENLPMFDDCRGAVMEYLEQSK